MEELFGKVTLNGVEDGIVSVSGVTNCGRRKFPDVPKSNMVYGTVDGLWVSVDRFIPAHPMSQEDGTFSVVDESVVGSMDGKVTFYRLVSGPLLPSANSTDRLFSGTGDGS